MKFYIYDLETMLNCFLFTGKFEDGSSYVFEMSDRANHRTELLQHLSYLQSLGVFMVGYNNLGFDYPIIHKLLNEPYTFTFQTAYGAAQEIIQSQGYGFERIRLHDRVLPQIDLMKINHFDNNSKRTSLKALQFAMRSESVEDLPFPFDTNLTHAQMDLMRSYNLHDVTETETFLKKCKKHVLMRKELIDQGVLSGDVLNYSDVKIGTEYLVKKIGRHKCFVSGSQPRQTVRQSVEYKNVILPKISFRTEPFQQVLEWFKSQTIYPRGTDRPKLEASLAGLQFHFGAGGVHASVENQAFESTATHVIKDIDVSGMYPAVAIANGFAPEHLGRDFVTAYKQLQVDRSQYAKKTMMNLVLKLAGNGASGNFENEFSCLYDPKCAYSVRINGQLQLIQLAELHSLIPGIKLIQANTDGITALVPRDMLPFFDLWKSHWEIETNLKLEDVEYSHMWIRDVNNYVARTTKGEIKAKGAYWYPKTEEDYWGGSGSVWNKDFSNMVVQKAIEQVLVNKWDAADVVRVITDPFDFMLRYKVQAGSKIYIGDKEMSKTVRYYVSTAGEPMKKVAVPKRAVGSYKRKNKISDEVWYKVMSEIPAGTWDERIHTKNKSKEALKETAVKSGWKVKECNHASRFDWRDVDFDYYVEEVKKLQIGVQNV